MISVKACCSTVTLATLRAILKVVIASRCGAASLLREWTSLVGWIW